MKKITILLFAIALFASCDTKPKDEAATTESDSTTVETTTVTNDTTATTPTTDTTKTVVTEVKQ